MAKIAGQLNGEKENMCKADVRKGLGDGLAMRLPLSEPREIYKNNLEMANRSNISSEFNFEIDLPGKDIAKLINSLREDTEYLLDLGVNGMGQSNHTLPVVWRETNLSLFEREITKPNPGRSDKFDGEEIESFDVKPMLLEFFLRLSDWWTRWRPRVSEIPVEEWEILFSLFHTLFTDSDSPRRVFVFFSLSGHQDMVVLGALGLVVSRDEPRNRNYRNVGASRFNGPYGRQGCVLARTVESMQSGRFDEAPVLQLPNFTEQFNLFTDASEVGIRVVLNQNHRNIAFESRTLNKAERNYTNTEPECLAVIWALNKLKTYFGSLSVKVITDHAALTKLTNGKNLSSRMIRWALKLSEFNIEWEHRPGIQNVVADILSRNPVGNLDGSQISCAAFAP
ncbi:retrovirus-related Pol polyprotein from transposon opus [Trichonephila clavipes]|nr:retrovirus-related Pol polyprotein from transposon opus [Trichonephila clavipes]